MGWRWFFSKTGAGIGAVVGGILGAVTGGLGFAAGAALGLAAGAAASQVHKGLGRYPNAKVLDFKSGMYGANTI